MKHLAIHLDDEALRLSLQAKENSARTLLARIAAEFAPAVLANSLGAEDMVLTDLIARDALDIDIFSLDTGRLPPETYDLMARLELRYGRQEIETVDLSLFMMSDAVTVGLPNQTALEAGGGLQQMLIELVEHGAQIKLCRTCAQARGIVDLELIPGVAIGTLPELGEWTLAADKVITF